MKEKILLVDDDKDHLAMMERCFFRLDINTTSAHGGAQAIEIIKKASFSIVISDIQMPFIDGVEVLHFVKKHAPETDVILVTGYNDKYSFTDVIKEGATDYLEKPFTKDEIEAKVNRIFRERGEIARRNEIEKKLIQTTEELRRSHQNLEKKIFQRTKDLHETQAELISVFESVPDGIISVNSSLVVRHKNNQCMSDLTVETGKVFAPGTSKFQQECHRILSNTLIKHEPVNDYRLEFNKDESNHRAFLVSTSCLTGKTGKFKGALLIIHDITKIVDLENQLLERRHFRKIVGESRKMQDIFLRIRQVASVDTTVLITGESGVGKELVVDTLHAQGDRSSKPLVKVNCSALPENLLESELFGHVKGAYTGALKDRTGRIQLAEGGILFLDEIGDISPRLQLQLLRFLELKEYERVGESQKRRADVRVFAATNANLLEKVSNGSFREDLYYRLKVMVIHVPPLRDRSGDIPLLIEHFLLLFNGKFKKRVSSVSKEVLDAFMDLQWRGNVRELKHAIEHAFLLCQGGMLELEHFPKDLFSQHVIASNDIQPARALTRDRLLAALNSTQWHRTKTAKLLKISRATLYNKLKEFGLTQGNP